MHQNSNASAGSHGSYQNSRGGFNQYNMQQSNNSGAFNQMNNSMYNGFNHDPLSRHASLPNPLDLNKQASIGDGQLNPKRFSIHVKNVPADKFKIESVCDFFKHFGEVI